MTGNTMTNKKVWRYQRGNQNGKSHDRQYNDQQEKFEDIKGVIRSRKLKDRQYNGQKIPKGSSEAVSWRRTDNTIAKRKRTTGQTTIYKTTHRKPKIKNTNPIKTGSIHWCCGRVSSSCFTYGTRRVILVSSLCRNLKGNITHNWKPLNFQMILLLFLLNI